MSNFLNFAVTLKQLPFTQTNSFSKKNKNKTLYALFFFFTK